MSNGKIIFVRNDVFFYVFDLVIATYQANIPVLYLNHGRHYSYPIPIYSVNAIHVTDF